MTTKKIINRICAIALTIVAIVVIYNMIGGYRIKYDVENHGKFTVGKYVSQDNWGKGELNYFIYYVDGKKYKGNGGRTPVGFNENIGKFYRIQYSTKYENHLRAFYNKEVTVSTEILKAGFSLTEMK